jgi:predicted aspartyl protease
MHLSQALALLPLLLAAACQSPTDLPQTARHCSVQRAGVLPVQLDRGFLLVPGALNHNKVLLLVDTGAEASMVTPQAEMEFRLDRDGRRHTTLHGIGGQITMVNARVTSFGVGDVEMMDVSIAVGPLPALPATDPPIGGLVGADYLSDYDVDLDVPHHTITLYNVQGCGEDFSPWQHAVSVVPIRRQYKDLLTLDVTVDGQTMNALLDSGARGTTISAAAAQHLGLDSAALAHDRATSELGVDRNTLASHLHQFDELRVGREVFHGPHLQVAPLLLPGAEMLLGADYLRTRHVWVSYATRRMFVAPPGQ